MKKVRIIIFKQILIKELCCSLCYFKKLHVGHKLLEISDEESLKKEKIIIDSSDQAFKEISDKAKQLKDNIEKEINEINKLYDQVNKQVIQSYEKKHEILIIEENNLKDKLQNEVTKVKEKLENFLSKSNQLIKDNERLLKGLQIMEKEDKNMIKLLTYSTKVNKSKKENNALFQELMNNLNISFNENNNSISYEKYFFNGIQIPKNIEFKDITSERFQVLWKIDDINIQNIDNKQIKFRVEIRKENSNEKFIQKYEGNDLNCIIKDLNENTNYEIRICSFYNNFEGSWSDIHKIRTNNENICDSIILDESNRKKEFVQKIYEWSGYKKMELLYRGSRDGTTSLDFHNKCDHKGPTICLYENDKGYIFGGYAPIPWTCYEGGNWFKNDESFEFTLTNIHGTEPTKFPHNSGKDSFYHGKDFGPTFDDFYIDKDYSKGECNLYFPRGFKDILNKGKSIFSGDFNDKISSVKIKEIEVFKVSK